MKDKSSYGFTIPELIVTMVVFGFVAGSVFLLMLAYVTMSSTVQLRASGLSVATEQMEYLRSLSYDNLAVQGGSIVTGGTPIAANQDVVRSQRTFNVNTDIRYADDAFDGCLNYGTLQSKYCRNYKTGTPLTDTNPRDYKVADVTVTDKKTGQLYAKLSSQFTSRVAETSGNSSAILATILDSSGSPVSGASVRIVDSSVNPAVDQTITTDTNGVALFLDVTPDNSPRYVISVTKPGYSSLSTIPVNGSLTPTYPNLNAIAQKVSSTTLKIDTISSDSLEATFVDETGAPVNGISFKIKGGIKLYTDPMDDSYSFTQSVAVPAGTNVVHIASLVPGNYRICYDTTLANACGSVPSRRILALRAAYGGNSLQPFSISSGISSPVDGGPMQRVTAVVSTSASYPRIQTIAPSTFSVSASDVSTSDFQITGANLSGATVKLRQGATVISGAVQGIDSATSIQRVFNLSGASQGAYEVLVTNASGQVIQTGVSPGTLGGINVGP
jgi:prepilin-type N-terminal cleavage/methylation domain-containing protein